MFAGYGPAQEIVAEGTEVVYASQSAFSIPDPIVVSSHSIILRQQEMNPPLGLNQQPQYGDGM